MTFGSASCKLVEKLVAGHLQEVLRFLKFKRSAELGTSVVWLKIVNGFIMSDREHGQTGSSSGGQVGSELFLLIVFEWWTYYFVLHPLSHLNIQFLASGLLQTSHYNNYLT